MSDEDRAELQRRMDLASILRREAASLARLDAGVANQITNLAYADALQFANGILERHAYPGGRRP